MSRRLECHIEHKSLFTAFSRLTRIVSVIRYNERNACFRATLTASWRPQSRALTTLAALRRCLHLICFTLGPAARPAHAQTGYYTYTLNDVSFNAYGGGTASGYFDYDPTTSTVGNYDVTTSDGTDINGASYAGNEYDNADVVSYSTSDDNDAVAFQLDNGLTFGLALRDDETFSGFNPYSIFAAAEGIGRANGNGFGIPYGRGGTTGTITRAPAAVPELSPLAAIALLSVLGCGALGAAGAKRRHPGFRKLIARADPDACKLRTRSEGEKSGGRMRKG